MRAAVTLLALMFTGSLVMWVGVPLAWLWIGSQVQAATDNVGAAIASMMVGVTASIAAIAKLLGWLTHSYQRAREARGLESTGSFPLEVTLVVSAVVAAVACVIWFAFFAGSSPAPVLGGG